MFSSIPLAKAILAFFRGTPLLWNEVGLARKGVLCAGDFYEQVAVESAACLFSAGDSKEDGIRQRLNSMVGGSELGGERRKRWIADMMQESAIPINVFEGCFSPRTGP